MFVGTKICVTGDISQHSSVIVEAPLAPFAMIVNAQMFSSVISTVAQRFLTKMTAYRHSFVLVGTVGPIRDIVDVPGGNRHRGICPRCNDLVKLAEDGFCNRKGCRAQTPCKFCGTTLQFVIADAQKSFCNRSCSTSFYQAERQKARIALDFWER